MDDREGSKEQKPHKILVIQIQDNHVQTASQSRLP